MEMNGTVMNAIEKVVPELSSDHDIRRLPAVCSPEEFRARLEKADEKTVIILADHVLGLKNEFLQGAANILVSDIAAKIKSAGALYAVLDHSLAKPYPNVVSGNALLFFDENRAGQYVSDYNKRHNGKASVLPLKGREITDFFMTMTRFGIEFVEIEPTLCKIRYRQKQLIKTDFDSITEPEVNFIMLRFLQLQISDEDPEAVKILELGMLEAISAGTFACMGLNINGSFEALLITDRRDGSKWIPCFTDTMEIQETYTTVPAIAKLLMSSQVVTVNFTELEKFMSLDKVAGVVINIGGYGMRINRETCSSMIKAAKKGGNDKK
ncbi:MAG: SseB family protein [Acutalibacteraceae bacterium]|nr:SseB family protein [Oscillospiraceae bacterium]